MGFLVFLLLLALAYLCFFYEKRLKLNAMIALTYRQMLHTLMEQNKFNENDYKKLIATVWDIDSEVLSYQDFNKKWGAMCKVWQIIPGYADRNTGMSVKVAEKVAAKMYRSRHVFQQYSEEAERLGKDMDEILSKVNDELARGPHP